MKPNSLAFFSVSFIGYAFSQLFSINEYSVLGHFNIISSCCTVCGLPGSFQALHNT